MQTQAFAVYSGGLDVLLKSKQDQVVCQRQLYCAIVTGTSPGWPSHECQPRRTDRRQK